MISAVAARKAAAAAAAAAQAENTPQPAASTSKSASDTSTTPKRKTPGEVTTSPAIRKKAKKAEAPSSSSHPPKKVGTKKDGKGAKSKTKKEKQAPARYFAQSISIEDSFKQGDDMIALGNSDDSLSESESSVDFALAEDVALSSDSDSPDDDEMQVEANVDISTFFPQVQAQPHQPSTSVTLSTFEPILDETVFPLTPSELSALGLDSTSSPASIVLLPAHASLCLVGVVSVTVLHGSLSLLGTNLPASISPHRIFAPRSAPLPILRCAFSQKGKESARPSVLGELNLPEKVKEPVEGVMKHGLVLLFQELKTGVEGLGRICRPFLGVFGQSRWEASRANDDVGLGVDGVSIVCSFIIFFLIRTKGALGVP